MSWKMRFEQSAGCGRVAYADGDKNKGRAVPRSDNRVFGYAELGKNECCRGETSNRYGAEVTSCRGVEFLAIANGVSGEQPCTWSPFLSAAIRVWARSREINHGRISCRATHDQGGVHPNL